MLFFCGGGRVGFGGCVQAEDAEIAGGGADLAESVVEALGFVSVGFDFEDELIGPRLAVNGAAFDFAEIDVVARKGFESGEERAGAMRELHGDGHFAGVGGGGDAVGFGTATQAGRSG